MHCGWRDPAGYGQLELTGIEFRNRPNQDPITKVKSAIAIGLDPGHTQAQIAGNAVLRHAH